MIAAKLRRRGLQTERLAMGPLRSPQQDDEVDSTQWVIEPFWRKLNSFFLFPLQRKPLLYALVLSLCAYMLMWGLLIGLAVAVGLLLAISRHAFKIAAYASHGVLDSNDYEDYPCDADLKVLPWKFFGVLLVHGFLIGMLARVSPGLGALGDLLSSFLIPATLMVLITSGSLRAAINPSMLLSTMGAIGLPYGLLCLFLFLLMQGVPMAFALLVTVMPQALLAPLLAFVVIYFNGVIAAMIGYVMYQNHADLGITPDKAPQAEAGTPVVDPQTALAQRRDAQVAQLVQNGDMNAALAEAREWQRSDPGSLADQRRYHRVLKLSDKPDELARHAQSYIALLLQKQRSTDALEVWGSCYKRDKGFRLNEASHTLALAQTAWKRMQLPHTLALLHGFEKSYAGSDLVPQALELTVRVLKQGANKPDQAVRVFMRMKIRYPAHACTQEAAWILRDELPGAAQSPAAPA